MDMLDISNESRRTYFMRDSSSITINEPKGLKVSELGHRIETKDGSGFYIFLGDVRYIFWSVHDKTRVVEV